MNIIIMIHELLPRHFPELLKEIPDPPKRLRYEGNLPKKENKLLVVVGSRKYSNYGREACESIIRGLVGAPVTVISGLALGIDSIAHRSALAVGLQTVAVPGSGLDRKILYPRSHINLAEEIIQSGGGLISEYDDTMPSSAWSFPRRNRIMAGLCHATLVIEAVKKSGTLITSRLATEYNREVGAVPGPVDSDTSFGPHMLIRLGAALVRDSNDVLELLGLERKDDKPTLSDLEELGDEEKIFMDILENPCSRNELIRKSKLDTSSANATLSLLEIKGLIIEELGEIKRII